MKEAPMLWGFETPETRAAYERNMERSHSGFGSVNDHCAVCGRKVGRRGLMVEVTGGGGQLAEPGESEAHTSRGDYMGLYPVGSECVKRLPAGVALYDREGNPTKR
jgi:hypothetical protein